MIDSCRPWKLEPGLVVAYSSPSVFRTSSMKSEPGFSTMRAETGAAAPPPSLDSSAAFGTRTPGRGAGDCALAGAGAASAAAPAAAPPRKRRRLTRSLLGFAIGRPSWTRASIRGTSLPLSGAASPAMWFPQELRAERVRRRLAVALQRQLRQFTPIGRPFDDQRNPTLVADVGALEESLVPERRRRVRGRQFEEESQMALVRLDHAERLAAGLEGRMAPAGRLQRARQAQADPPQPRQQLRLRRFRCDFRSTRAFQLAEESTRRALVP